MSYPLFDLADDLPLLDFTDLTAARTLVFPDMSGRAILSNAQTVDVADVSAGGSIGSAASTVDITQAACVNQTTANKVLTLPTPTANLCMFYTLVNVGTAGFYVYGRFIAPGDSQTFIFKPSSGWRRTSSSPQVIAQSWVSVTAPANDTNENTLATITIPGGVMGANGVLQVRLKADFTSSGNSKITRVRLGGSLVCTSTTTSVTNAALLWDVCNRNSESSQIGTFGLGVGTSTSAHTTATVDTAADQALTITMHKGLGSETMTLHGYSITLQRFD